MTELTVQLADRSGTTASLLGWQNIGSTSASVPDYFANTGREFCMLRADTGGTAYFIVTGTADGNSPDPKSVIVTTGDTNQVPFGPFPEEYYSSSVQVYQAGGGDVEIAIIRV